MLEETMEVEEQQESKRSMKKKLLLIVNSILLAIGTSGGPLVMRLYFIHGGNRVWLSSFLETSGFPIILLPLTISHIYNKTTKLSLISMKPPLFFASAVIGILTGLDDYLYACGIARLPVSTASLIQASHLGFTAVFAFLLVRQKFTVYSVNSIVLLTLGSVVLALRSEDRLVGESTSEYVIGFVMILAAAALYGLVLPLMELVYKKSRQNVTYSLVMEIQLVMCFYATLFCTVGMIIDNDFKVIPREAKDFKLGETKYYIVLVWSAITWQFFFLGAIGVIFCSSSLFSGIIIAALLPVTEILAVIVYKENFQAEKGVALVLSLWGFVSYFYGEIKETRERDADARRLLLKDVTDRSQGDVDTRRFLLTDDADCGQGDADFRCLESGGVKQKLEHKHAHSHEHALEHEHAHSDHEHALEEHGCGLVSGQDAHQVFDRIPVAVLGSNFDSSLAPKDYLVKGRGPGYFRDLVLIGCVSSGDNIGRHNDNSSSMR